MGTQTGNFPGRTAFTEVNIASLLLFLKRRGGRDVVEVIIGSP